MSARLLAAYRRSRYEAAGAVARIGRRSPAVDALMSRLGVREGGFVTAWNPFSRRMPDGWNQRMQARLEAAARRLPGAPGHGGDGRWREAHWLLGRTRAGCWSWPAASARRPSSPWRVASRPGSASSAGEEPAVPEHRPRQARLDAAEFRMLRIDQHILLDRATRLGTSSTAERFSRCQALPKARARCGSPSSQPGRAAASSTS